MDIQQYIRAELLVLVPVMYLVGIGLKKSKLPDKWIPLLLGGIGVLLAGIWVLSTSDINGYKEWAAALFLTVTQGVLTAGASVYAHQICKQAGKEKEDDG